MNIKTTLQIILNVGINICSVSTAPPTPLYNIKLTINLSQVALEQRKRWKIHLWMVERERSISRTLITYVAKSSLGTVFNSHSHTFHCVLIKNQQLPKSQNCFSMQPHAVSLITMVIQSQTFLFYSLGWCRGCSTDIQTACAGLSQLGGTKFWWARDLFPHWRIHMGKNDQKQM